MANTKDKLKFDGLGKLSFETECFNIIVLTLIKNSSFCNLKYL